jgi:hypothetical protein
VLLHLQMQFYIFTSIITMQRLTLIHMKMKLSGQSMIDLLEYLLKNMLNQLIYLLALI